MEEELIQALSFIKSSTHRRTIIDVLCSNIYTPSEIANASDLRLNHVSMYLGELKAMGIVECLNEDAKRGRLYQLTDFGKRVHDIVK
jgi:DNA-binding MarR family transcriptional regulator